MLHKGFHEDIVKIINLVELILLKHIYLFTHPPLELLRIESVKNQIEFTHF